MREIDKDEADILETIDRHKELTIELTLRHFILQ